MLTRAYPITATYRTPLSHNPVELLVLILPVMRLVFKTTDRAFEPASVRADGSDVSVASTHRFRDNAARNLVRRDREVWADLDVVDVG